MKTILLFLSVFLTAIVIGQNAGDGVTDIDSNFYNSVVIGTQEWMSENLDVSAFRNGDPIPQAKTNEEWKKAGEEGIPAWCFYDNDPADGIKYGKLYNWYAINDSRGLAPLGWHLPSDKEWSILTNYLGGAEKAVVKMKTKNEWPYTGLTTNSSGFSGLPGGYRISEGIFWNVMVAGGWWSSSEDDSGNAWNRDMGYTSNEMDRSNSGKNTGLSVRCIKD